MSLPDPIERYVLRALAEAPVDSPGALQIAQEGRMWMRRGARGLAFTASEHFEVRRVAFSWRARFRGLGLRLDVVDGYDHGSGLLELRVYGVRIQRQSGPELATGEATRYLAELPWVPYAMRHNDELEWREIDEHTLEVAADVAGERAAVTFHLDGAGDIAQVSARRRRQVGKNAWEETDWGGMFSEYEVLGGVRMPTAAEVYWDLDDGRFPYWSGRVLSASPR